MTRTSSSSALAVNIYFFILSRAILGAFWVPKGMEDKANIRPLDSLVFIGESLRMECQLFNSTTDVTPADIHFQMYSHLRKQSWNVSMDNITVVDNKTVYADIEVTEEYLNFTTVTCFAGNTRLCATVIHAERPIQNVTNFTGLYYYNGDINLSWSLGQMYLDVSHIVVKADWNPNRPPNLQGNPCYNQMRESCTINQTGQDIIFVRILVDHALKRKRPDAQYLKPLYNTNATSVHKFIVNKYRKTSPPYYFRTVGTNSTCAILTWDHPLYFTSCRCNTIYELTVTRKNDTSVIITDTGVRAFEQESIHICSLSPYTSFILRIKIKGDEENPWSDPALTEFTTDEDRPLTGPPMTDTSYCAGDCVLGHLREVILYWNDPLKYSLQGELTKFEITVDNTTKYLRKGSNLYKASLDCGSAHEILIYSSTKVGLSMTPSEIIIPKKSDELPMMNDVKVRMEEIKGSAVVEKSVNVMVTWNSGVISKTNVTFILYMCQETSVPYTCLFDFTTTEISADNNEMVIKNLSAWTNLFGYALRDGNGQKRGIQWINCVYRPELKPYSTTSATVNAGNEANVLIISWISSRCDRATKVLILQYHVFICRQQVDSISLMHRFCSNVTVSSTESTYVAKNLNGGSPYYVYIQGESPAGLGSLSRPAIGIPDGSKGDWRHVTGITMGVLAGVIFVGVIIVCCLRKCQRSRNQMKSLIAGTHTLWEKEGKLYHQVSKESGIGTASSPTSSGLERSVTPPSVPSRSNNELTHEKITDQVAQADGIQLAMTRDAHEMKDSTKVVTSVTPVPNSTVKQSATHTSEHLKSDQVDRNHGYSNSYNTCPYVKITNTGFSSDSCNDTCSQVPVDEGYSSPNAAIDSPVFLGNTHQNVNLESNLPFILSQSLNVLPPISSQSQNVSTDTKLSPISSQSHNVFTGIPAGCLLHVYNVKNDHNMQAVLPHCGLPVPNISDNNVSLECSPPFDSDTEIFENQSGTYKSQNSYRQQVSPGYVTCTVNGEMNFTVADASQETDLIDLQNSFSNYKPNCKITQSGGVMSQQSSDVTTQEGDQSISAGYKSMEFIESSHNLHFGSQDRSTALELDGLQDSFETHKPGFSVQGELETPYCSGSAITGGNNGPTSDYLRQAFMDSDTSHCAEANSGLTHVEKDRSNQAEATPGQVSFQTSIFRSNCLESSIADDKVGFRLPQGDYQSHNRCGTQAQSDVEDSDAVSETGYQSQIPRASDNNSEAEIKFNSPEHLSNCPGYVSLNCLQGDIDSTHVSRNSDNDPGEQNVQVLGSGDSDDVSVEGDILFLNKDYYQLVMSMTPSTSADSKSVDV